MNLKNMPVWAQLLLALAAAAAIYGSQWKLPPLNFSEKYGQIEELQKQLDQRNEEIRKGELALKKLEELKRETAALERKLEDLKQILPTEPEMGDLLKWIKSLADQTNLDLIVFNPQPLADREFLREQPIVMQVVGNYHQLGLFYDRISKYARIINVEDVRINPNMDRKVKATIRADFVAKTYIYKEEKAAPQKGPGGGA